MKVFGNGVPRVARVEILSSDNDRVVARAYPSLAAADAALAAAFAEAPPPEGGAYHTTDFVVVWTDGTRYRGQADTTRYEIAMAPKAGGILRQYLASVALLMSQGQYTWLSPGEQMAKAALGKQIAERLAIEPALEAPRNLLYIPEDHLVAVGTTSDTLTGTFLPDPDRAVAELEERFAAIRPPVAVWMGHGRKVPQTTNRDVQYAANWISLALANDLPRLRAQTGRAHGALWDRWAKTVEHVRRYLGPAPALDATYRDNQAFWSRQVPSLATSIKEALDGDAHRNAATDGPIPFRVTYRLPNGTIATTYHPAHDYLDAKRRAAYYLGYTPDFVSIDGQYTEGEWSRVR